MTAIAFLGLGQMGSIMAARLVDAGHDVTVWNRTAGRAEGVRARGASVASTPSRAAADAEVVMTMLADPPALDEVLFGEHGVAEGIRPGAAVIDLSTVGPAPIRAVASRLPDGVDVLDAPVRGSVDKARAGSLGIVVGGTDEAFARWRSVLEPLGTPMHVGELGAGQAAKVVNNVAVITAMALVGEALGLAERLGLERDAAFELLEQTYVGDAVRYVRARLEPGDFAPRFKADLAWKDLRLALDGDGSGPELRTVAAAASWYEDAEALGLGDLDFTVVAAVALGERPTAG
ncbi:MAG TPA: NAD(P)-dependent oxidoreductase [Actinomycetota bacterium]|nr:NAD(P)-dependent oxidoreductase [Actinomycetota bacterium]